MYAANKMDATSGGGAVPLAIVCGEPLVQVQAEAQAQVGNREPQEEGHREPL